MGEWGIGLSQIIPAILIVMKILNKIELGWFWVITSIIWVPIILIVGILVVFAIFTLLLLLADAIISILSGGV